MLKKQLFLFLLFLSISVSSVAYEGRGPAALNFKVIANKNNPLNTISRKKLSEIFLKKISRWPNQEFVLPVDHSPSSDIRGSFSVEILNRPVSAVKNYWQQMIFSGRNIPPPEFDSEEDIIDYVMQRAGGVGYVSAATSTNGVKVLRVE